LAEVEKWEIGSKAYEEALRQEGDYWGQEVRKAVAAGIPFSVDMRRAEKIYVDRGKGLPQQQTFDPTTERIMNGELYQYLFEQVAAVSEHARVLVLTCGPGNLSLELARLGHHVHGMDISEGAIEIARKFAEENPYKENFGSIQYSVTDLNRIEFEPNSLDVVVAWDGLHHILLLDRLMQQVRNALKPNGVFIFSDNIGMHWKSRLVGGLLYFLLPTHVSYFTKLKYVLGGQRKVKEEMSERSPFEEVNTESILPIAEKYFDMIEKQSHTGIGYRAAIAGDLRFPSFLKYRFLRCLKKFDDWAVQHGLLKGDHILVIAKPKSNH